LLVPAWDRIEQEDNVTHWNVTETLLTLHKISKQNNKKVWFCVTCRVMSRDMSFKMNNKRGQTFLNIIKTLQKKPAYKPVFLPRILIYMSICITIRCSAVTT
jgi:hypothetical protein